MAAVTPLVAALVMLKLAAAWIGSPVVDVTANAGSRGNSWPRWLCTAAARGQTLAARAGCAV